MVVLDTSVIIKWFVEEPGSDKALFLMKKHIEGAEIILVPSLFFYEIANVLRYHKNLPTEEILEVVEILQGLNLRVEEIGFELMMKGIILARERDISVYDAVFVILAKIYQAPLYTADLKLYRKVKDLGFVKLL